MLHLRVACFNYVFSFVKEKRRESSACKSKTFVLAKTVLGWFNIQIKSPVPTKGIVPGDSLLANRRPVREVFVRGLSFCWAFRLLDFFVFIHIPVNIL
jgi:hypothetical protein